MTRLKMIRFVVGLLAAMVGFLNTAPAARADKSTDEAPQQIRESVIAGSWYPASAPELRQTIQQYLQNVPPASRPGRLIALISPHAGYVYSGQIAAHAYKLLEDQKFASVVVIAPSHRANFDGVSIYDRGPYLTPLGLVALDRDLIAALKQRENRIRYVPEAHSQEHSLEIQLPFLQTLNPDMKLVPLVMGDQGLATCQWLAEALADIIGDKSVLIVASSDLSHYHPYDQARRLDQVVVDHVRHFDPQSLHGALVRGDCEACGGGPMTVAMLTAQRLGANHAEVLHYANSGDVTGERGKVVGYLAAAFWADAPQPAKQQAAVRQGGLDLGLNSSEKRLLHEIAKETIEAQCNGKKPSEFEVTSTLLKEPRGCFVTLKKHGRLRGCIGQIVAVQPLYQSVAAMAAAAAFEDPRFAPVSSDELGDLDIEISVLSPLKQITKPEQIQVGVHGLIVRQNGRSGLLLPQVATEYGWNRTEFLKNTCLKAGLPVDSWSKPGTELYVFSADVF